MKLNLNSKPGPIPANSPKVEQIVRESTHAADAEIYEADKLLDRPIPEIIPRSEMREQRQLSKLVDENFPFDDSQRAAISGLSSVKYGCMTGAAGTGKTTCTKAVVDGLADSLPHVNMATYFKNINPEDRVGVDPDDDYETPESLIPAIAMCAYTGRATQMIKKNFPRDWHGNIMTIHRLLGFVPEWYDDFADLKEDGEPKKKVRFVPTYTAENKLPWKVLVIDEAGMLGLELWHQLLDALTDDCRIIMIGDIQQLTPTHGKSVFGFALGKWPSWELTHIHRQQGVNNSIVDNAWRIIHGNWPKSDDPKTDDWKFVMMPFDSVASKASKQLRKWLQTINGNLYDPIRDTIITPINAYEETAQGFDLGQDPLNRELALLFNSNHGRYIIDAGRGETRKFAVGDKVMATKNDHESGITNGMTGVIEEIYENGDYGGNAGRFGLVEDVQAYLQDMVEDDSPVFTLEDLTKAVAEQPKEKEQRDRGPASHSVVVRFGSGEHSFTHQFRTLAEVNTLMVAYVVTCHKMQGGESPVVIIICHQAHKRMLSREWLYTAVTRASQKCIVLYTQQGMSAALGKQEIKGKDLKTKVESYAKLMDSSGRMGATVRVRLPMDTESTLPAVIDSSGGGMTLLEQESHSVDIADDSPEPQQLKPEPTQQSEPSPRPTTIVIKNATIVLQKESKPEKKPETVDGGTLRPQRDPTYAGIAKAVGQVTPTMTLKQFRALSAPVPQAKAIELRSEFRAEHPKLIQQWGAVKAMKAIEDMQRIKLLPKPPEAPKPKGPVKLNLFTMRRPG